MAVQHILMPSEAVRHVCHDDQMVIWTGDVAGRLSMDGFMRDDLTYDDVLDVHEAIKQELMRIMESAFDHPEARTLACPGHPVERKG